MAKSKRPTGKLLLITDEDIKNLKFIKEAAKTWTAFAEWTGFSAGALRTWMSGETHEIRWHTSTRNKIRKVARDLNPEPVAVRVPVFSGSDVRTSALDLAIKLRNKEGELEALRLVVDLMRDV